LPLDAVTVAEVLKEAVYVTGCFWKWHLGYTPAFFPRKQGFDEFVGLDLDDGDFFNHVDRSGREDWWRNESKIAEEGYTTDLLTMHRGLIKETSISRK
jgi:arylsulfatase A-like enzyme